MLTDRKIILGITGGIAAYKVIDWLRELRRENAEVTVIMTESATKFVTPLTLAALSGNQVYTDLFDQQEAANIPHINLGRNHDLILIAPATASTIARLANGLADDLLSATTLAGTAKVLICPAMNSNMYLHPATQVNLTKLKEFGYIIMDPENGKMACNEEGPGRLPEWQSVREEILTCFSPQDLSNQAILVSAGPTREPLDPVRYLGNRSTGKMGFALAATAHRRGAKVTLVSGPVTLPHPPGVKVVEVNTATEMHKVIMDLCHDSSIVVKAAAVSDFRPGTYSSRKIKKQTSGLELKLEKNPDILAELGLLKKNNKKFPFLIGFAAESHDLLEEGWRKLKEKNLDMIVVNDITSSDSGFETDSNRVTILDKNGTEKKLPLLSKEETSCQIWDRVVKLMSEDR
ncbi:MAG: bifunctional phosphopantothenoylcysteine decarboxylase/phosphopantothenate--cysteine ligase CoaBC [Proteobacteria bacterium]|nr:bifunctional phosphopantothenoylcysteine decarboxylase/phosphopantothenate--cysteine ligase CoaBC [Pseudomonadota bacterium]MBU1715955.1 bifunctional phosphopantothenoylcysteine decarboxylase/phosphopantothenate--cysteine ligase CoaBC [Pseudomonadota bacterium]